MPRYFFDLVNAQGGRITDIESIVFDDLQAPKTDAQQSLSSMGGEQIHAEGSANLTIEIRDENGEVVCRVSLAAGADC